MRDWVLCCDCVAKRWCALGKTESALVRSLERDALLVGRVERLMNIPAVGPITALTWALEVGDVQRFSSCRKELGHDRTAHAAVLAAQQTFTDDLDRGGQDGAPQQPGAGHAL